ncbi:MAG: hypothetical protein ACRD0U_05180, partial [Acidimicrobiales bacterium]
AAVRRLLALLQSGERVPPFLGALIVQRLGGTCDTEVADSLPEVVEWLSATPRERGAALWGLLELVDRLPAPAIGPLTFPPLARIRE